METTSASMLLPLNFGSIFRPSIQQQRTATILLLRFARFKLLRVEDVRKIIGCKIAETKRRHSEATLDRREDRSRVILCVVNDEIAS